MLCDLEGFELPSDKLATVQGGSVVNHIGAAAGRLTRDYFGYQSHAFKGQSRHSRATWFRP